MLQCMKQSLSVFMRKICSVVVCHRIIFCPCLMQALETPPVFSDEFANMWPWQSTLVTSRTIWSQLTLYVGFLAQLRPGFQQEVMDPLTRVCWHSRGRRADRSDLASCIKHPDWALIFLLETNWLNWFSLFYGQCLMWFLYCAVYISCRGKLCAVQGFQGCSRQISRLCFHKRRMCMEPAGQAPLQ